MKVKLLKKIRKRFKFSYYGIKDFPFRLYWQVLDSKKTEPELKEHVSHYCFGDMIRIDSPTIAEQLAMDVMGIMYVYNHRQHRFKMRNIRFRRRHFNG